MGIVELYPALYTHCYDDNFLCTQPISFVDDILEIVNRDKLQALTDHLNSADPSNSIKFTDEREEDNKTACFYVLITRRGDGTVKLLVYRKSSHTDQYLSFHSHHPLHHKLGVIRTLMDRCRNIVSEEEDRKLEEQHIMNALERCGYLRWTFMKVKKQMNNNKEKTKRREKHERSKGLVVIPYVKGISEPLERIYRKHNISTAMRPHMTLRKILVHPKDKREKKEQSSVVHVYSIPCIDCGLYRRDRKADWGEEEGTSG